MSDLFSDAARERAGSVAPLALRLRPRTLDEFLGQRHILGEGSALRLAIAEDRLGSAILYGPPGSGKTTLARIVAGATGAEFEELSAVSAEDLEVVVRRGADALGAELADDLVAQVAIRAGGDARNALNIVELAVETARAEEVAVEERHVEDASRKRPLVYDKTGDQHYD